MIVTSLRLLDRERLELRPAGDVEFAAQPMDVDDVAPATTTFGVGSSRRARSRTSFARVRAHAVHLAFAGRPWSNGTMGQWSRPPLILLIDDDTAMCRTIERMLDQCELLPCPSVRQATELLENTSFDVILCDVVMPDASGIDFLSQLERSRPDQVRRLVFITGAADVEGIDEFLAWPPKRWLSKPFTFEQLEGAITGVLSEHGFARL